MPTNSASERSEEVERSENPKDHCCQLSLCPLLPHRPWRSSTAGASAEAWNIRRNDPYTLDPYTPTFSAQRVYGPRRFSWSARLLVVRSFVGRGTGVRVVFLHLREARAGPVPSGFFRVSAAGAARSLLCVAAVLPQAMQPSPPKASPLPRSRRSGCGQLGRLSARRRRRSRPWPRSRRAGRHRRLSPCTASSTGQHMSHRARGSGSRTSSEDHPVRTRQLHSECRACATVPGSFLVGAFGRAGPGPASSFSGSRPEPLLPRRHRPSCSPHFPPVGPDERLLESRPDRQCAERDESDRSGATVLKLRRDW